MNNRHKITVHIPKVTFWNFLWTIGHYNTNNFAHRYIK